MRKRLIYSNTQPSFSPTILTNSHQIVNDPTIYAANLINGAAALVPESKSPSVSKGTNDKFLGKTKMHSSESCISTTEASNRQELDRKISR